MSHIYVVGKTGTGKTTLLETMLEGDIRNGVGCALLDPHGDLAERLLRGTSAEEKARIVYVDPADPKATISYNPLMRTTPPLRPLVAAGLLDVFKLMWSDAWGSRMEHVLRNALLALLDQPKATLPDILLLITDDAFRKTALPHIQNEQVRRYWEREFPAYAKRYRGEAIAPIQSKVGALLADPRLLRFFTAKTEPLRLRTLMDDGKVLVVNLSKGRLGADSSALLGGVLTTMLGVSAFSRVALPENRRRRFFVYIDEFQTFTTLALAQMLAELRKTGVAMVLAHQFLQQIDPPVRHAVLGNAGTLITFRVGAEDAAYLAKELEPKFSRLDLINLPNHHIYLRLMIDGAPSRPFSATTILPDQVPST
ncbi:type IV secretion system DNA-binding domain-containing protein [Maricaulis sp.]|uniref:type IV secretory system conjugative DNA transfer family protein n=1 Tax=Maricaulis sp. TaxID=1486257 RepID=UPI0032991DEC